MNPENVTATDSINEDLSGASSSPNSSITRRSFIKRTSATAVATCLALSAFRSEALACDSGGSSEIDYSLEMTGWPEGVAISETLIWLKTQQITGSGSYNGHTVTLQVIGRCSPYEIVPDEDGHYLYSSFGVSFAATVQEMDGTTVVGGGSGALTGSLGATLGDEHCPEVGGYATINQSTGEYAIPGTDLYLSLTAVADDGTPTPLESSVSPFINLVQARVIIPAFHPSGLRDFANDTIVCTASGGIYFPFTFSSYVP